MPVRKLPALPSKVEETFKKLKSNPVVVKCLKQCADDMELTIKDQIMLTETESPPFHEEKRGKVFADYLRKLGLKNVRIDKEGNVIGVRPGKGKGPRQVLGAHLDTVFPPGTPIKVTRKGNVLRAPGISDDARGLAVLLEVLRVLQKQKVETVGDVLFIATVGEEGNGDLRGSKYLFGSKEEHVDGFISVDEASVHGILCGSTGSRRFRVTYTGPGGHSWSNFGNASANHALGRAITKIDGVRVKTKPKSSFNVGVISGGTSINAIADKAVLELDTRSENNDDLNALVDRILPLLQKAADEENARWKAPKDKMIKVKIEPIGHRPAGTQPDTSPVLFAARGAMKALGLELKDYSLASTDQNVPISLGIPATTIGGGGSEGNNHNVAEWWDCTDSFQGPQLSVLTVLSLVGLAGCTEPLLPKRKAK